MRIQKSSLDADQCNTPQGVLLQVGIVSFFGLFEKLFYILLPLMHLNTFLYRKKTICAPGQSLLFGFDYMQVYMLC